MSLGLIQPGASAALRHPKTGALLAPLYVRKNGTAVWPVLGAASDDPDDPEFTGEGEDDDADDETDSDEDDEDDDKSKRRGARKTKKDDDDEDDEDEGPPRAVRQAKKYRLALRKSEEQRAALDARIKLLENKDKPTDEVVSEELTKTRADLDSVTEVNRIMTAQLAFFKTNTGVTWVDPSDAFALAEREGIFDDVIDEDGTVDTRELRRSLKDLAKRKKYLVVPEKPTGSADKDDEEDEEEERPRRSARTANTRRKGTAGTANRAALEKKFPVLRGR